MNRGTQAVTLAIVAMAALAASPVLMAQTAQTASERAPVLVAQAAPAASAMSDGEVRKVDKDAGKITLRHGPIPNLDMPNMTMVFRVKDPAMLDQVKAGDKVRFTADMVGGQITVMKIELKT